MTSFVKRPPALLIHSSWIPIFFSHTHFHSSCSTSRRPSRPQTMKGYLLFSTSSVTFLILCWTLDLCWSSSCSIWSNWSSSNFSSSTRSVASFVLLPGPPPLHAEEEEIQSALIIIKILTFCIVLQYYIPPLHTSYMYPLQVSLHNKDNVLSSARLLPMGQDRPVGIEGS